MLSYVFPVPSASNIGFQPNLPGPRAGTILPLVRPSNKIGSVPGPALYAKVQSAQAFLFSKPVNILFKPIIQLVELIGLFIKTLPVTV